MRIKCNRIFTDIYRHRQSYTIPYLLWTDFIFSQGYIARKQDFDTLQKIDISCMGRRGLLERALLIYLLSWFSVLLFVMNSFFFIEMIKICNNRFACLLIHFIFYKAISLVKSINCLWPSQLNKKYCEPKG